MLYSYQKATPDRPSPGKIIPRYLRIMPLIVSALGLGLVAAVIWPLASYQLSLIFTNLSNQEGLLSPIYYESFANETTPNQNEPLIVGDVDYTHASNWFTFSPSQNLANTPSTVKDYNLAIPSLGITKAMVKVGTDDLAKSLIHYNGTALPGEYGSPVIFGHSTLPQLFNANNYLSIFATLPTVKVGADVLIDYDGVLYTYKIKKMYEVKPEDVWVLRQDYSQKTLKLITCVPPGTKIKRLIIEADLIKT